MIKPLNDQVCSLLRTVATTAVLPRYRRLSADEVTEKMPGELVTIADREAEAMLAEGLASILPDARFIGEEACAADPALLAGLSDGWVWLVDPIDGTGNFASGRPPFAIMVALLHDGEAQASWIHDPLSGRIAHAERGGGAYFDARRVGETSDLPDDGRLSGILSSAFLPASQSNLNDRLEAFVGTLSPTQRCAGHEYPLVANGERDFCIYWRTLPWDHAAGALLLNEAGGVALRIDGSPYRPGSEGEGLILARNVAIGKRLLEIIN